MPSTLLESIGTTPDEFLSRISLRMIVLPSGSSLPKPIAAPTGAMVYGKLLYGGVTRFRLIGNGQRRAGERQLICSPGEASRGWLQYGGSPRNYVAVDMGPCLCMELELSPKGPELAMMGCADPVGQALNMGVMSAIGNKVLSLDDFIEFQPDDEKPNDSHDDLIASAVEASMDVCELEDYFCSSTGGLRRQIDEIVRRVLDGRVVRPADETLVDATTAEEIDRIRREEMKGLLELGLHPPKGLLLYGPPGCGKTQLAREISRILNARPPKIVAAPELLDRWDGASETTRASAVNQLLSKLDGVNALDNILLIGMTNRRELLDPALLRPGRLEVHIEIPLPDQEGRREILNIHFDALRKRGRLSQPLMEAIDGRKSKLAQTNYRWMQQRPRFWRRRRFGSHTDLASDENTRGFSGADIAGLVRCAGSISLARTRQQDDGSLESLVITLVDVLQALEESGSTFHVREKRLFLAMRIGYIAVLLFEGGWHHVCEERFLAKKKIAVPMALDSPSRQQELSARSFWRKKGLRGWIRQYSVSIPETILKGWRLCPNMFSGPGNSAKTIPKKKSSEPMHLHSAGANGAKSTALDRRIETTSQI
eukprot:scaffold6860_cov162-Amphora_coffeaeformis.AAC.5